MVIHTTFSSEICPFYIKKGLRLENIFNFLQIDGSNYFDVFKIRQTIPLWVNPVKVLKKGFGRPGFELKETNSRISIVMKLKIKK